MTTQEKSSALPEQSDRDASGRFLAGVSGNPVGRPKGKRNRITELQQDLEIAIREHVPTEVLKNIITSMAAEALAGNTKAAKLIMDKFIPNAKDRDELEQGQRAINIIIQNLTKDDSPPTVTITQSGQPQQEED